jgi:16S rRNA processing protein RimM
LMAEAMVRVGRVGRAHGRRGAFRVADATERLQLLEPGRTLTVEGVGERRIAERLGTAKRPILRLDGADAAEVTGRDLLVPRSALGELRDDEWLVDDLTGCTVEGLGEVTDVVIGPSVDYLRVHGDGGEHLVPLNRDAIRRVDLDTRRIEADLDFLGLRTGN